jgi:uncharacterized Zn-finger protein
MNAKIEVTPSVELEDASYQSAFCPNPNMPIWSSHPRIFLDFGPNGEAKCPYCSTVYKLKPGIARKEH